MEKETIIDLLKNMDVSVARMIEDVAEKQFQEDPKNDREVKERHDIVVKSVTDKYRGLVKDEGLSKNQLEAIIVTIVSNLFLNRMERIVKESAKRAILDEGRESAASEKQ